MAVIVRPYVEPFSTMMDIADAGHIMNFRLAKCELDELTVLIEGCPIRILDYTSTAQPHGKDTTPTSAIR